MFYLRDGADLHILGGCVKLSHDFGNFSPEDMQRVQKEVERLGELKRDKTDSGQLQALLDDFFKFLTTILKHSGLLTPASVTKAHSGISVETAHDTPVMEIIRQAWNQRAEHWAVVESPFNYIMTMRTLLEYITLTQQKQRREYFLSLGTGPGLYEMYLSHLFQHLPNGRRVRLICADIAHRMSQKQKEIQNSLALVKDLRVTGVNAALPLTADMSQLAIRSESIDQIICNNSLQWAADWKQVVREMARVIKPDGLGLVYLFVHLHPMNVFDDQGKKLWTFGQFQIEELLDELEANRFDVVWMRQMAGQPGTGQAGGSINRMFVRAKFAPRGIEGSWRDRRITGSLSVASVNDSA
jgi:SAM-dependent methyltransferase